MANENFHFESSKGVKLNVPFMQDILTLEKLEELQEKHGGNDEKMTMEVMTTMLPKASVEKIRKLPLRDLNKFVLGWTEQETLGES